MAGRLGSEDAVPPAPAGIPRLRGGAEYLRTQQRNTAHVCARDSAAHVCARDSAARQRFTYERFGAEQLVTFTSARGLSLVGLGACTRGVASVASREALKPWLRAGTEMDRESAVRVRLRLR